MGWSAWRDTRPEGGPASAVQAEVGDQQPTARAQCAEHIRERRLPLVFGDAGPRGLF